LSEPHGRLGIEPLDEADRESGIECVAAAARAFHRDVESWHREGHAHIVVVIGAVLAQREHARLDAETEEILRRIAHVGQAGERLRLLDRRQEIVGVRQECWRLPAYRRPRPRRCPRW
jgi:hypothetical protein